MGEEPRELLELPDVRELDDPTDGGDGDLELLINCPPPPRRPLLFEFGRLRSVGEGVCSLTTSAYDSAAGVGGVCDRLRLWLIVGLLDLLLPGGILPLLIGLILSPPPPPPPLCC